jgi:betaine reductase
MLHPVIKDVKFFMAHTPGLVRHGSKPSREIKKDPKTLDLIQASLRSLTDAISYAPHQVMLGNIYPDDLSELQAPWYENPTNSSTNKGPHGEMVGEEIFYGLMKSVDDFGLVLIEENFAKKSRSIIEKMSYLKTYSQQKIHGTPLSQIEKRLAEDDNVVPLALGTGEIIGLVATDYADDPSLSPEILLENLTVKATATMALKSVLESNAVDPESIDYVIGSGEEAIGDRYNRGGGNLAKAVAEAAGCMQSTGADIKAFCCAPVHAAVVGGSLITSGVFPNVVVIGGCSLAKLGMKYQGHLKKGIPIMEDVLVGFAILLGPDDHTSPILRLDSVGRHTVAAGSIQQKIVEALVQTPLSRVGLKFQDIGKYATEMHNPEITDTAGSGNVPRTNYRLIAALAALNGEIETGQESRDAFVKTHGMPGFSPTQGHVASAIPFLGHALDDLKSGKYQYSMFLAKGSLFLGRMTHMSDGESFILEKNH